MSYIVIDCFGGAEYAMVVTDESGNNKVFNTKAEADAEAKECQDGRVVKI